MEIHQIVIRVPSNMVIVLYDDGVGGRHNIVFDSTGNLSVAGLLADCQGRIPAPSDNPAKAQIERDIAELENRVTALKATIGAV